MSVSGKCSIPGNNNWHAKDKGIERVNFFAKCGDTSLQFSALCGRNFNAGRRDGFVGWLSLGISECGKDKEKNESA